MLELWLLVSFSYSLITRMVLIHITGGGSEEILSELALREEAKDLFLYHKTKL